MLLFFLLTFVQVLIDPTYCACQTWTGRLLLIAHHFIHIGLFLGSVLFGHHLLHLVIVVLSIGLHLYSSGCFLTKINNRLCKIDINKPLITFTNHIMNLLQSKANRTVYYTLALLAVLFDLYSITR